MSRPKGVEPVSERAVSTLHLSGFLFVDVKKEPEGTTVSPLFTPVRPNPYRTYLVCTGIYLGLGRFV